MQSTPPPSGVRNQYQYAVVGNKFAAAGQRIAYARFNSALLAQIPISIMCEMVLSGSLTDCKEDAMEFPYTDIQSCLVSEAEAREGPDTFLGVALSTFPRLTMVPVPYVMAWSLKRNGFQPKA